MIAIACVDQGNRIGLKGNLLYQNKKDMKIFKELTEDNVVIMGRKTWDSLPRQPLSNRVNIVLTKDEALLEKRKKGVKFFDSKETALSYIKKKYPEKEIFIIGGSKIYEMFINDCDIAIITKIEEDDKYGDAFFPMDIYDIMRWRKEAYIECGLFIDKGEKKMHRWSVGLFNNLKTHTKIDFRDLEKKILSIVKGE